MPTLQKNRRLISFYFKLLKKMEYDKRTKVIYGGDRKVKVPNISFAEHLYTNILKGGNSEAIIDDATGEIVTYNEIIRRAIIVAKFLQNLGLKKGDIISIYSENRLDFLIPVLSSLFSGIIVAPMNFSYIKDELAHCLAITKPQLVFCSSLIVNRVLEIRQHCPFIKNIVVFDDASNSLANVFSYKDILESSCKDHVNIKEFQLVHINPVEDVAAVFSSSGTTGLPKGVMLTHRNLMVSYSVMMEPEYYDLKKDDRIIIFLPLFHAYGCLASLYGLSSGIKLIIMRRFEEERYLQLIERYRVPFSYVVPPICVFLAKSNLVDKYDLSSLRYLVCGAAPLSKEIDETVCKRLNISKIRQGYGMTEITLAIVMTPNDITKEKSGTVGKVLPGIHLKVVDVETGKALGPNQEGELCFKGDMLMKGYYGNSKSTAETFDEDGWLHSGDIGYYDEDLYIFVVDRLKELIKYKGFQVAPAELEALILQNEHVKDVGVVGKPDEISGELPCAFIVRQPGSNISEKEIIQYVAERVSRQKHLHGGVIFVNEIPKNPSGKILRRKLREMVKLKSSI